MDEMMHHAIHMYGREERSRCRMNRICAVLKAISFCERKNSGKSAATTKITKSRIISIKRGSRSNSQACSIRV